VKGILSLVFGIIAILSSTLSLVSGSPVRMIIGIIFWCPGVILGGKASQSKQPIGIIGIIGFILSIISLIETLIFAFIYLIL
jgi:hypothetical protein